MQVQWGQLDPATAEQIIAVLLSLENPDVVRIDGRGGDGGRDVQFRRPEGVDFYEIKSFADRLDTRRGRRANVERSLAAAARRTPASWTLVVPVDPTEAEEAWFHGLQERFPFPLRWRGLTWLSARLAEHPEVQRYYFSDERDAVISLLREHDALHADAADADALLDRLGALARRLRDLDPHVMVHTSTLPLRELMEHHRDAVMFSQRDTAIGPVTLVVLPRYAGAARDSPLTQLQVDLRFPDTAEGRQAKRAWEAVHNWGEPGRIGAEHVQIVHAPVPGVLGTRPGTGELRFPPRPPVDGDAQGRLVCRREGRARAALPVAISHLGSGQVGVSISGSDRTGTLAFHARLGPPTVSVTLTCRPVADAYPVDLLPALRLYSEAQSGSDLALEIDGMPAPIDFGSQTAGGQAGSDPYLSFVEDLASVQDRTRVPFPLPADATAGDVEQARALAALLRDGILDEPAPAEVTVTLRPGAPSLPESGFLVLLTEDPQQLLGHDIDLGTRHTVLGPCRVELSAADSGPPGTTLARIFPELGARNVTRLGAPVDDAGTEPN
jgi:hypothetical protein